MFRIGLTAIAALLALSPLARADAPSGNVVVPKTTGDAIIIWQATPFVDALSAKHPSQAQAEDEIVSAALGIIAARRSLFAKATSVSLRVMYVKMAGQNDPQYAATSFAGFKRLLSVKATKAALAASQQWPSSIDVDHLPTGVTLDGVTALIF